METGVLHLHSALRWVILLLLLIVIFRSIADMNRPFTPGHRRLSLMLLIVADLMLVIGFYQWFTSPLGLKNIQNSGMSAVMKNATSRFFAVEHLFGMLIAIVLIHIGYSHAKKQIPDKVKHKRMLIFFLLALLIIVISIPWPFRAVGAGRGWF